MQQCGEEHIVKSWELTTGLKASTENVVGQGHNRTYQQLSVFTPLVYRLSTLK